MKIIIKWFKFVIGTLIVLLGLITFWLPIPIGLPLLLVGGLILVRHSSDAKRLLITLMRRYPQVRQVMQLRKSMTGTDPTRNKFSTAEKKEGS
ncbi:MAG: hypothetical protein ABW089_07000 [Sedimenticola sp.]